MSAVLQRKLDGTGPGAVDVLAVEGSDGKDSATWQIVENVGKRPIVQGMWEYFSLERAKSKKFPKDAEKEGQEGIQGQWQQESLVKGFLDSVKEVRIHTALRE